MADKSDLLGGKNKNRIELTSVEDDAVTKIKNWYSDRYEYTLVQRNVLFLIAIISLATVLMTVIAMKQILDSKSIEPFILTIEDKTGITNVVNPLSRSDLTSNEALNRYFVVQYLRNRETYDPANYDYNYKNIVRLFSTPSIYSGFSIFLNSDPKSPLKMYGQSTSTKLKIRSIQFLDQGKTAQVRFTIIENNDEKRSSYKIATIGFVYAQMEMNMEDRYINPLGFQVTVYRVDDEVL
jgi:type IV secretion system protein VirB8